MKRDHHNLQGGGSTIYTPRTLLQNSTSILQYTRNRREKKEKKNEPTTAIAPRRLCISLPPSRRYEPRPSFLHSFISSSSSPQLFHRVGYFFFSFLIRLEIFVRCIRSYGRCIDAGICCVPLGGFGGSEVHPD